MSSFNHTTIEGDRIDTLAVEYYGNLSGIKIILDANPNVPIVAVYRLGTVLTIPIVDQTDIKDKTQLPPWKK